MRILHKKKVPLYRSTFIFTSDVELFKKRFNIDCLEGYAGAASANGEEFGIWLPSDDGAVRMSDLAHEAFHCAIDIAERVGLEIHVCSNNEAVAYLITWITETVLDCLHLETERKMQWALN